MLNPVGQPGPGYHPVPPADPTLLNPLGQVDPAYQQGQPYDPQGQPYPSVPQYPSVPGYAQAPPYQQPQFPQAQFPQGAQQFSPQPGSFPPGPPGQGFPPGPPGQGFPPGPPGQGFPPGPPGQGFPPPYGPGGSGSGGGGKKVLAVIGSILMTLLVIAGVIGVKVLKSNAKHNRADEGAGTTTSFSVATGASGAPTTRPSAKVPPPTTERPTTAPTTKVSNVWIAATYNEATNEVHWARSSLSQEAAVGQAQRACGASCQEPVWSKDACVAFAFGDGGGWASDWGNTTDEAQDKALARAKNAFSVPGPFKFWSKCARDSD